ncbi:MAG TPA: HRDC domain-containing protein [Acidimicrobiales bacterium]|nr:HRDC domain-containing protein [Acidimicrobiales bacterium]
MLVADDAAFADLLEDLATAEAYAVDAEFQGESSYYPRLAVLQFATPDRVAVVDATTVDVAPLRAVLDGPGLMVAHAGEQDLQVLLRATGTLPSRMLDTQIAAGFLGYSSPSLAKLVSELLGVRLEKGARMSDWFKRPLTAEQITYAAADVLHLLELRSVIEGRLDAAGRLAWAYEESERRRRVRTTDVDTAWWRLKGFRQLRGPSRGVAQELAAWRERTAMATDKPARRVLADETVLLLAERPPRGPDDMPKSRLFDARRLSADVVGELLAAVARGRELSKADLRLPPDTDLPGHLQPLASLVAAWVAQQSRDLSIDPALAATRSDIEAYLRGVPESQLAHGWRAEFIGATVDRIVAGTAAVAYDGDGSLILVDRPPPTPA